MPYILKLVADREKGRQEENPGSSKWQYFRRVEVQFLLSLVLPYSVAILTCRINPRWLGSFVDGEGVLCGYWGVSISPGQAGAHSGAARSEHHNFRNGENSRGMFVIIFSLLKQHIK